MIKRMMLVWAFVWTFVGQAWAQSDIVWVQIEAQPSLNIALQRAQDYAAVLDDANSFAMDSGWYGIAIGPYERPDAEQVLRIYRAESLIPRDSFITFSSSYGAQVWPLGADVLDRIVVSNLATAQKPEAPQVAQVLLPADETPNEAARSERLLGRAEREALQVALKWAGTYPGRIDGAFGRGTRNAMAAWQDLKGFDRTGILTTRQRDQLLGDYNAVLEDLGLAMISDTSAGIEMVLPLNVVSFEKNDYPFAHYTSISDIPATVLLISQAGDQDTLLSLYDIMQTLDIVPLDGPRKRKKTSFTLVGEDATRISETRVSLEGGQIKGFTLVWPTGDEERRSRLIAEMDKSFARLSGVIPTDAGTDEQAVDLIAGLQVRKPRVSGSGFFVDSRGAVLTTAKAVDSCTRITLDDDTEAQLTAVDTAKGVALLRPNVALSPQVVARFSDARPRLNAEVAASGYSFGGVLNAPSITFGTLSDVRGLAGENHINRLALNTLPGDAGGPVLDAGGGVLGMLLPNDANGRTLPQSVRFALDRTALHDVLAQAGLAGAITDSTLPVDPVDLSITATGMTVLVSCWD
jgi:S1-C subfamily serine protease/peptidoglycan hydrolase-like protein with peptidoglycan-binding domain